MLVGVSDNELAVARRKATEGEQVRISMVHIPVPAASNVIRPAEHGESGEMGERNRL